jgi:hypothetical protein
MSKPVDKTLYDRIKKRIYKRITKHSAYRSGLIVKEYKEAFAKKYGKKKKAYLGKKTKEGLSRWFKDTLHNVLEHKVLFVVVQWVIQAIMDVKLEKKTII